MQATSLELTAGIALIVLAGVIGLLARRDLSRPYVAFGIPWLLAMGLAQLQLTDFQSTWSGTIWLSTALGATLLIAGSVTTGGLAGVRGTIQPAWDRTISKRVLLAAALLSLAGIVGLSATFAILGGIPALAGEEVRAGAYTAAGGYAVPLWAGLLAVGLRLAFWLWLIAAWLVRARRLAALSCCFASLLCLGGLALQGSRNALLLTVLVALIGVYLVRKPRPMTLRSASIATAVALLVVVSVGGIYALRNSSASENSFSGQSNDEPLATQIAFPVYFALTYPFEAEGRLMEAVPSDHADGRGLNTFSSLPDSFFPNGKANYRDYLGTLTYREAGDPYWTVATYQGRSWLDYGFAGNLVVSLLIGCLLGIGYKLCRTRSGFGPALFCAYLVYLAAFLVYDNAVSSSLSIPFEMAAILAIGYWCVREQAPEPRSETLAA